MTNKNLENFDIVLTNEDGLGLFDIISQPPFELQLLDPIVPVSIKIDIVETRYHRHQRHSVYIRNLSKPDLPVIDTAHHRRDTPHPLPLLVHPGI